MTAVATAPTAAPSLGCSGSINGQHGCMLPAVVAGRGCLSCYQLATGDFCMSVWVF